MRSGSSMRSSDRLHPPARRTSNRIGRALTDERQAVRRDTLRLEEVANGVTLVGTAAVLSKTSATPLLFTESVLPHQTGLPSLYGKRRNVLPLRAEQFVTGNGCSKPVPFHSEKGGIFLFAPAIFA